MLKITTVMKPDTSFGKIKDLIDKARYNALKSVNSELVSLYWDIGSYISKRMKTAVWGKKTIDQLAEYLNGHGADYKGFNRRNLYRMRQFYETYQNNEIVSPVVTQLSWSKHLMSLNFSAYRTATTKVTCKRDLPGTLSCSCLNWGKIFCSSVKSLEFRWACMIIISTCYFSIGN